MTPPPRRCREDPKHLKYSAQHLGPGCCQDGEWLAGPGLRAGLSAPVPLTGLASVVASFFLATYYNIINAWAFWYLFHSFQVSGRPQGG